MKKLFATLLSVTMLCSMVVVPTEADELKELGYYYDDTPMELYVDLDGDGVEDNIKVYEKFVQRNIYDIIVEVNDKKYVYNSLHGWLHRTIYIVDINNSDNTKEILIKEGYHSASWYQLFRYENSELKLLQFKVNGKIQDFSDIRRDSDEDSIVTSGNGTLSVSGNAWDRNNEKFTLKTDKYQEIERGILTKFVGEPTDLSKEITVTLNGNKLQFDQPPILRNDRTLVPMRAIFEALGAEVKWNDDTQTVTAIKGNTLIKITIGEKCFYKNGKKCDIDVVAILVNDRTLVPVRAISEALSCKVDWDESAQNVIITTNQKVSNIEDIVEKNASEDEIRQMFGEPDIKEAKRQEMYTGFYYQNWVYDDLGISFRMYSEEKESEQYVDACTILEQYGGKLMTGIGIGSHKDEVLKAYGDSQDYGDRIRCTFDSGGEISFALENDYISHIYIGGVAE